METSTQELELADSTIVIEVEYLPWTRFHTAGVKRIPTCLDLHEDHTSHFDRGFIERLAFGKYGRWQFAQLHNFVSSREGGIEVSTVEESIADSYSAKFEVSVRTIYNAPDQNDLRPSKVDSENIRLVRHGMGTKGKGIEAAIKTLRLLDERNTLDLIVFSSPLFAIKTKFLARLLGVSNRLTVKPGVPLAELPLTLNAYEVALIIMSNVASGHLNALSNKLFESIHSKLAIVTGPNQAIRKIVRKYELGLSLDSWNPEEAASVINSTAAESWSRYKSDSRIASQDLSSRQSRLVFNQILNGLS